MSTNERNPVKSLHAPIDLTIEVTRKCPLNCLICSSEGGPPYDNELTTNQLKRIIEEAKELGTRNICFSGGEPFEHNGIVQLCKYSKLAGLDVQVYTSGNIRRKADTLDPLSDELLSQVKPSVDKIIVGLHGPTPKIHESITRVPGSFENAIISIERAAQRAIQVEVHFVPVKLNYRSLSELIELARKLKVNKISILRFVPQGRGKTYSGLLSLQKSDVLSLKSILTSLSESKNPQVRIGSPFKVLGLSQARCTAGENRATVRADGCVFPCEALKHVPCMSNDLHLLSLREIWQDSEMFKDARTFASSARNRRCAKCYKFDECGGGCLAQSLLFGSSAWECSDPYCFEKEVASINV